MKERKSNCTITDETTLLHLWVSEEEAPEMAALRTRFRDARLERTHDLSAELRLLLAGRLIKPVGKGWHLTKRGCKARAVAPLPMVTGATNCESEPTKTSSPITVLCLLAPS